jgi:hypothetical protein
VKEEINNDLPPCRSQNEVFERKGDAEFSRLTVARGYGAAWLVFAGISLMYRLLRDLPSVLKQALFARAPSGKKERFLFYINRAPYGLLILWIFIAFSGKIALEHNSGFFIFDTLEILPLVIIYINLSLRRNMMIRKRIFISLGHGIVFSICIFFTGSIVYLITRT